MYHMTSNRALPYPQSLVYDVLGQELAHPPHDLDDSVEYILETQWQNAAQAFRQDSLPVSPLCAISRYP